ncbi:hypothetical protein PR048_023834 [Dryococelus australis]|uniref:Uncharacterized protein n=1 Tax=Dryococelus australis TaxID=614101 RepID=A0ABQ9GV45_9NEOP|nr:hypothetical protein PR048_023834 [Dryococelus australis]
MNITGDNWFISQLANELSQMNLTYVRTIKKKSELPAAFVNSKGRGKIVYLISTIQHSQETDESTGNQTLWTSTKQRESIGKCTRWPMAIFHALLDIAGVNANVLFSGNSQTGEIDRRYFLVQLGKQLVDEHVHQRNKSTIYIGRKYSSHQIIENHPKQTGKPFMNE